MSLTLIRLDERRYQLIWAHHHLILDQPLAFVAAVRAVLADWDHSVPRPAG